MIPIVRITVHDKEECYTEGYFITTDQLAKFARDFQVDCHDGFVSNQRSYILAWMRKEQSPVKTPSHCYAFRCVDQKCLKGETCTLDSRNYPKKPLK